MSNDRFTEDSYEQMLIALFGQIGYGSKLGSDIKRELTDRLATLRDTLLPRLMSGKLNITI